jgi:hypothetical protein
MTIHLRSVVRLPKCGFFSHSSIRYLWYHALVQAQLYHYFKYKRQIRIFHSYWGYQIKTDWMAENSTPIGDVEMRKKLPESLK